MSLKIVCWNIRHGGRRTDYIISALLHHRADVILLTEYRANAKGAEIKSTLLANGWVHQVDSAPPPGKNGVLIAWLYPLEGVLIHEDIPPESHRWLTVTIGGIIVTGAYFPQRHEKVAHWRYMMHLAEQLRDTAAMFIGDFNTGKHHLDEAGATFFHPEYIGMMEERGWLDAWRALHPDAREYSWFSAAGNGFRIDHAYVSPMLQRRVLAARYSHDERLERISDHSILIIELDATGLNIR